MDLRLATMLELGLLSDLIDPVLGILAKDDDFLIFLVLCSCSWMVLIVSRVV